MQWFRNGMRFGFSSLGTLLQLCAYVCTLGIMLGAAGAMAYHTFRLLAGAL